MYSYVTSSCNLVATFRGIVSHFVQTGYVFFVPVFVPIQLMTLMTLNIAHEYVKIIINLCISFFLFSLLLYIVYFFYFHYYCY